MWKMTVMTLSPTEAALLKLYAEMGGTDAELMGILRLAYANLKMRSRAIMLSPVLCERLQNYVRGTLNREGEALARRIFGRSLNEVLEPVNF